ncbi:MAG: hypothetical protein HZC49_07445, partial [Nitrospirae bacterium]|nr:hypothetical protein [Nitrospirota bacterium]
MIKIITIFLLVVGSANGATQQIPSSFPNLSKLDVGEAKGYVVIYYNSSISKVLNHAVEETGDEEGVIRAIETKVDAIRDDIYVIDYSAGPSGDPHFIIHRKVDGHLVKMG